MRLRDLLAVGAAMAFLAGPGSAQRAGAPKLGVDGLVLFRDPGSVAVLVRATPFWQAVSTRSEELLGDFQYMPQYATAGARGQIFEILRSDAMGWIPGSHEPATDPGRFIAVPWEFGPGCAGEAWRDPVWVTPGDTVAFLLFPTRSRSADPDELAVFDVLGWQQPYPVGELIPFWRKGPRKNPVWLTAGEFFELLTVLPSELAYRRDPDAALAPALGWLARRPGRESSFPIPEILQEWERRREERGPGRGPGTRGAGPGVSVPGG
ncbi:MAG: hypothetical protein ACWGSQ_05600 [Longimicrobiales bacterium]